MLRWRLIKVPAFCYCLALEESIIMKNHKDKHCLSQCETGTTKLLSSLDRILGLGQAVRSGCICLGASFKVAIAFSELQTNLVFSGHLLTLRCWFEEWRVIMLWIAVLLWGLYHTVQSWHQKPTESCPYIIENMTLSIWAISLYYYNLIKFQVESLLRNKS